MTTIQRYIAKSILAKSSLVFMVGICILSMARSLLIADIFLQQNAEAFRYILLLLHFLPHYIGYAAPFALYAGTYSTFRRMAAGGELTAMSSLGVSRLSLTLPVMIIGLVTTGYLILNLGWLDPLARYEYRRTLHELENQDVSRFMREKTFFKLADKIILVTDIDYSDRAFQNVFLFQEGENSNLAISAERASLDDIEGDLVLTIQSGTWLQTTPAPAHEEIERTDFENISFTIAEAQGAFRPMGNDEQEFSFPDLVSRSATPPAGTASLEMESELYRKLGIAVSPLILTLAGIGFGLWASIKPTPYRGLTGLAFVLAYHQLNELNGILSVTLAVSPRIYSVAITSIGLLTSVCLCLSLMKSPSGQTSTASLP